MVFLWADLLWLLLLVPVLIGAYLLAQRRRKKFALRFANLSLVKEALGRGPGSRRHIPPILFLSGITVMLFAMARPAAIVTLPSQRSTVILTIDISGSMRAQDLEPSRLDAAKTAARAFVENQPRDVRIGVVAFSATAALVQPPTKDREDVLDAIDRLRTQRGTSVGSGLLVSLEAVFENPDADRSSASVDLLAQPDPASAPPPVAPGSYTQAVVVLLSDGQSNQGPDPLEIADQFADRGVRVFTVGVGSPGGAVIGIQGRSIRVRLDEATLKRIAEKTGATYSKADSETDLRDVYRQLSTRLVMERERTEITALLTAAAAVILLVGAVLSLLWLGRIP